MPDEMDLVQAQQAEFTADALRDHWRKQPLGQGLSHCEECGDPIPEARRRVMPTARLCMPCQKDLEIESRRNA